MQSWSPYIESNFLKHHEVYAPWFMAKLLPELILSICEFLPYEDLVCFSLCSRRLFNLVEGQKRRMSHTRDNMLALLNQLEQDLPGHFACDICLILHKFDELENLSYHGFPNFRCEARWIDDSMVFKSRGCLDYVPPFSFIQVKLAMKRFYQGPPYGISTDRLEHTQVSHRFADSDTRGYPDMTVRDPDFTLLFSRNLAVCHEPLGLYMRTQDIIIYRRKWDHDFLHSADFTCPLANLSLCCANVCHIVAPLIERLCNYHWPLLKSGQLDFSITFPYTCSTCRIDAEIEICEFDSKLTVIMTKWMNLGCGISKEDPLWQTRVNLPRENSPIRGNFIKLNQGPRECFENTVSLSFQNLRSRNLFLLEGQTILPFNKTRYIWASPFIVPMIQGQRKTPRAIVSHVIGKIFRFLVSFPVTMEPEIYVSPFPNRLPWREMELLLDSLFKPPS